MILRRSLVSVALAVILITSLIFMFACSSQSPAASSSSNVSQTAAPAAKTLKIGSVNFLGASMGVDQIHSVQNMVDMENANGGMKIGNETYNIQLIGYDSNNSEATEVAAVNKLIFEDKVSYIISDGAFIGAWINLAETNKVLSFAFTPSLINLDPKYSYSFNPSGADTSMPAMTIWYIKTYPDKAKNWVFGLPDNQMGHMYEHLIGDPAAKAGVTINFIFYPAASQDLSSLGTKVMTLNPGNIGTFTAMGGGDVADALAYKAVWSAGYKGQYFDLGQSPAGTLAQLLPADALEGFMNQAQTAEFDPALTDQAEDFKKAWIAKYGKWDGPNIGGTANYACLKTGLQQAGTTDPAKVAAVISNGMKYEGPNGTFQMISRPDLGNNRTADSVVAIFVKQIKDGKASLLTTVGVDEVTADWKVALGQ